MFCLHFSPIFQADNLIVWYKWWINPIDLWKTICFLQCPCLICTFCMRKTSIRGIYWWFWISRFIHSLYCKLSFLRINSLFPRKGIKVNKCVISVLYSWSNKKHLTKKNWEFTSKMWIPVHLLTLITVLSRLERPSRLVRPIE